MLQKGLNVELEMQGRQLRSRRVSTDLLKPAIQPFHKKVENLRYPMNNKFAWQVWAADLSLSQSSVAARPLCTPIDRRYSLVDSRNNVGIQREVSGWG